MGYYISIEKHELRGQGPALFFYSADAHSTQRESLWVGYSVTSKDVQDAFEAVP
jgi:hypothetical protein